MERKTYEAADLKHIGIVPANRIHRVVRNLFNQQDGLNKDKRTVKKRVVEEKDSSYLIENLEVGGETRLTIDRTTTVHKGDASFYEEIDVFIASIGKSVRITTSDGIITTVSVEGISQHVLHEIAAAVEEFMPGGAIRQGLYCQTLPFRH